MIKILLGLLLTAVLLSPVVARPLVYYTEEPIPQIWYMEDVEAAPQQLTNFPARRAINHAALSPGLRYLAWSEVIADTNPLFLVSKIYVLDRVTGVIIPLADSLASAGGGGVDWDQDGYLYFGAEAVQTVPPQTDIYRVRFDDTGLEQLTFTLEPEADIAVSEDGTMLTYVRAVFTISPPITEVWVSSTSGWNARLVYASGEIGVASAHDPELSPNNGAVIFSMVNWEYNNEPWATAHDLWIINTNGNGLRRITPEGPVSVVPDWVRGEIVYTQLEEDGYTGMCVRTLQGCDPFGPPTARKPKYVN